jgi:hypothetical protein
MNGTKRMTMYAAGVNNSTLCTVCTNAEKTKGKRAGVTEISSSYVPGQCPQQ